MIRWHFFGATDVGRKRVRNEDAWGYDDERGVFVVADGMGGHAAGEQASRIAVETILKFFHHRLSDDEPTLPSELAQVGDLQEMILQAALRTAHRKIIEAAQDHPDWQGMATTVVVAYLDPPRDRAFIAHVGDSRVYLIRRGKIFQLTQDHSWINEQLRSGLITAEQARTHPLRNVVTRALGAPQEPAVDMSEEPLFPDDFLLLCTDGLSGVVEDGEIRDIVLQHNDDLSQAVRHLIDRANEKGGPDNITVVLIRILPGEAPP